jgi:mono/diheme cytochrome c family protein
MIRRVAFCLLPSAFCLLALAGCQQKMARQPSFRPLEPSSFFPDGRSARPLPPGTVASPDVNGRGRGTGIAWPKVMDDPRLLTGRAGTPDDQAAREAALVGLAAQGGLAPLNAAAVRAEYVDTFPIPIDRAALERGRERFNIFCAVCHDETGHGRGKIVERGYTQPPSYVPEPGVPGSGYSRGFERRGYKELLMRVPVGYFFEVMTRGYGAMPDYASQIPPEDRWKIAAYVRALQLSQYADLNDPRLQLERPAVEKAIRDALKEAP